MTSLCRANVCECERRDLRLLAGLFQRVSGFVEQIWYIDAGERVSAVNDENIAGRTSDQRFAGAQDRKRAFQSAKVNRPLGHRQGRKSRSASLSYRS